MASRLACPLHGPEANDYANQPEDYRGKLAHPNASQPPTKRDGHERDGEKHAKY